MVFFLARLAFSPLAGSEACVLSALNHFLCGAPSAAIADAEAAAAAAAAAAAFGCFLGDLARRYGRFLLQPWIGMTSFIDSA